MVTRASMPALTRLTTVSWSITSTCIFDWSGSVNSFIRSRTGAPSYTSGSRPRSIGVDHVAVVRRPDRATVQELLVMFQPVLLSVQPGRLVAQGRLRPDHVAAKREHFLGLGETLVIRQCPSPSSAGSASGEAPTASRWRPEPPTSSPSPAFAAPIPGDRSAGTGLTWPARSALCSLAPT